MEELDKEVQRKVDWLNARRNYITSSGVTALDYKREPKLNKLGLNNAQMDLLVDSLTEFTVEDTEAVSKAARWGHLNEAKVLGKVQSIHQWDDCIITKSISGGRLKGFGCSPDGLDVPAPDACEVEQDQVKAKHAAEVKSFGPKHHLDIALNDAVDEEILDQLAWYFVVIDSLEDIALVLDCPKITDAKLRRFVKYFTREDLAERSEHLKLIATTGIDKVNTTKLS